MSEYIVLPGKCKPMVVSDLNFDDRLHSTLRPAHNFHHRLDPKSSISIHQLVLDTFIASHCSLLDIHLHNNALRFQSPSLQNLSPRWVCLAPNRRTKRVQPRKTQQQPQTTTTITSPKTFPRYSQIMLPVTTPTTSTTITIQRPKRRRSFANEHRCPSSGETVRPAVFKRSVEVLPKLE